MSFRPTGTIDASPTALALGFNVSSIYFACCKYAGYRFTAYLQHAFVYCMMSPKAKAIGLVSIVPVGRKDIHSYPNSERNHCLVTMQCHSCDKVMARSFPYIVTTVPLLCHKRNTLLDTILVGARLYIAFLSRHF